MLLYMRAVLCMVLVLAGLAPAAARTFYTSTAGSDAVSCTQAQNIATPKRTVQAGENCMTAPGDTLYIRAGTYEENQIDINVRCTASLPCTIAGYPGDAVPVLRSVGAPAYTGLGGVILIYAGEGQIDSYLTLRDVTLDGINLPLSRSGIWIQMAHTTIENITIRDTPRNGMYLAGTGTGFANHAIIRGNSIIDCGRLQPDIANDTKGAGVYVVSANVLIEDNLIDGCRTGIEMNYGGNVDNIIRNNVIRNLGADSPWGPEVGAPTYGRCFSVGLVFPGTTSVPRNMRIYNNVCYNAHGANGGHAQCINFTGASDTIFANNTCYDMDYPYFVLGRRLSTATVQNNIFAGLGSTSPAGSVASLVGTISHNLFDPNVANTFVDAANGDFHLKAGSTAINTGTGVAAVTEDYEGDVRPLQGLFDIGADEFSDEEE